MDEQHFDLNNLMQLSTDYDLLKKVLEYLLARDKSMSERMSALELNFKNSQE